VASLRDLQHAFAAALRAREGDAVCDARPAANLAVYRNNASWQFRNALSLSFPVLLRRVGEEYFRQLAVQYRASFPSRSGDLHWVGRDFADFLAAHLAGSEYAWLADLARLEWAREMAAVSAVHPPLGAETLAEFTPDDFEHLVFSLQPSLHLGISPFPVVSIWIANQGDIAAPVDQSTGEEAYMVLSRDDHVMVSKLTSARFSFLAALADGAPLGEAMARASLDEAGLLDALRFTFAENLACGVQSAKR
jgi:hypothetical protein